MDKKYGIIGLVVIVLVVAIYSGGGPKNLIEDIKKLASPDSENKNADDTPNPDDVTLDRIVQKIKNDGLHDNRTIIKSPGGGSGGSGSGGSGGNSAAGCSMQSGDSVTLTGVSGADYFIRAKVTGTENQVDAESGKAITYTYAEVDEYEKIVGTVIALDENSGKPIINENISEGQYLEARASVPDLDPDQLLIISYADSGSSSDAGAFTNMLVEYESPGGFSVVC